MGGGGGGRGKGGATGGPRIICSLGPPDNTESNPQSMFSWDKLHLHWFMKPFQCFATLCKPIGLVCVLECFQQIPLNSVFSWSLSDQPVLYQHPVLKHQVCMLFAPNKADFIHYMLHVMFRHTHKAKTPSLQKLPGLCRICGTKAGLIMGGGGRTGGTDTERAGVSAERAQRGGI